MGGDNNGSSSGSSADWGSSSSSGEPIISKQIGSGAVLLTATGKLRGSRARALGDQLDELADGGVARVVLDLTALTSLDSLASFAIERALERGLRVHLVVRPSFQLDQFFAARSLGRRGLRAHHTLEDALARVRQVSDSTVFA